MTISDFRFYWTSLWPNAPFPTGELLGIWKPLIDRAEKKPTVKYLRWFRAADPKGEWPPAPNVISEALALIKKPKPSGQRGETAYQCDHCGERIMGTLAYDAHLTSTHADEVERGTAAGRALRGERCNARLNGARTPRLGRRTQTRVSRPRSRRSPWRAGSTG
jgi:hypothetical protein